MKLIDLNLLIYAINRDSPYYKTAHKWWENCLSENETIGFSWIVVLGFLRLTTSSLLFPNPLTSDQAMDLMDEWLMQPPSRIILPTERHWDIFKQIISPLGTAGNLTTDAHLAALAVEYGATLCSTDNDFSRFQFVKWVNPLLLI